MNKRISKIKAVLMLSLSVIFAVVLVGVAGCQVQSQHSDSPLIKLLAKILPPNAQQQHQELVNKLVSNDADERREGVWMLSKAKPSHWESSGKILTIMAQGDPDPQVRIAALTVLAKIGPAAKYPGVFIDRAKDNNPMVREASVEILAKLKAKQCMDALIEVLNKDPESSVRAAAAKGLGNYHNINAVRALLRSINDDDFSVAMRSCQALCKITGTNCGYDQQKWRVWLSKHPINN